MRPPMLRHSNGARTVSTGVALIFHSLSETDAYARRIDSAIESLYRDMRNQTVYADPDAFEREAIAVESYAPALANKLRAEGKILEKRAKKKSDSRIAKEESFGIDYTTFYEDWKTFYHSAQDDYHLTSSLWDTIETYDTLFRKNYDRFAEGIGTPSGPKPPTNEDIEKDHPDSDVAAKLGKVAVSLSGILWPLVIGGAVIGGGVLLWKFAPDSKKTIEAKPEPKSEPKAESKKEEKS